MTDQIESETEVLIVGAGPTGLTLGIELRRRGIDCRLIDRKDDAVETSRALGINPRTLQAFDDMGVLEPVLAEGTRVTEQGVYVGDRELFRLEMGHVDTPYPYAWFLPQNRTEKHLIDRLAELGGKIEYERELTGFGQRGDGVTATVSHLDSGRRETISAAWLVGTDGARSRVRKTLGLTLEGETLPGAWLVADAYVDWDYPADQVGTWLHAEGVFAALPMAGDDQWRLFVEVDTDPDDDPDTSVETFQRLARKRTGDRTATVQETTWTSALRINQRMVEQYRRGRVFLAGDAAHVHSPVGGLGMNTGIQDAYNLGWKLTAVATGAAPEDLLDTYETERLPVAAEVLRVTGLSSRALVGLVEPNPAVRILRDRVLPRVLGSERVQEWFLRGDTQLGVSYPDSDLSGIYVASPLAGLASPSLLDGARRAWRAPKAGDRAPTGHLELATGERTTLFDELNGETRFSLILFAGTGADRGDRDPDARTDALVGIAATVEALTGGLVRSLLVVPEGGPMPARDGAAVLLDPAGALHDRYDAARPLAYLLRPDGYVGFRSRPARLLPLVEYLNERFELPTSGFRSRPSETPRTAPTTKSPNAKRESADADV